MSRPLKDGADYFSLDCQMDDEIKYIEAEFGIAAFGMIIKLWQKIYGNKGYYCTFTRTVRLMFSQEIGKGENFVDEVINRCMDYGIFDRRLYKKYGVLTSAGIQKRFAKMTERRKPFTIDGRYLLISAPENWVIDNNNSVNVDNNARNVGNNGESKVNTESKYENKEITTTTTNAGAYAHEPPSEDVVAQYFKSNTKYADCCKNASDEAHKFCAYNAKRNWDCLPDWKSAADLWAARSKERSRSTTGTTTNTSGGSFDTDEFFQAALKKSYGRITEETNDVK